MAGLARPFPGLILHDFGAQVTSIVHTNYEMPEVDIMGRRNRSLKVDLKHPDGVSAVRELALKSHVVIDPYRPGTMEKLGLGPDVLMKDNLGLVYARLTGK